MARTTATGDGGDRSARSRILDSAYASVGLGGVAWTGLTRSVERIRTQAPHQARALGRLLDSSVQGTRELAGLASRELDDYAERGRELFGSVEITTPARGHVRVRRIDAGVEAAPSTDVPATDAGANGDAAAS